MKSFAALIWKFFLENTGFKNKVCCLSCRYQNLKSNTLFIGFQKNNGLRINLYEVSWRIEHARLNKQRFQ